MKKKIAMILTAMLIVVFALTACGSGSKADPIEGNWETERLQQAVWKLIWQSLKRQWVRR